MVSILSGWSESHCLTCGTVGQLWLGLARFPGARLSREISPLQRLLLIGESVIIAPFPYSANLEGPRG